MEQDELYGHSSSNFVTYKDFAFQLWVQSVDVPRVGSQESAHVLVLSSYLSSGLLLIKSCAEPFISDMVGDVATHVFSVYCNSPVFPLCVTINSLWSAVMCLWVTLELPACVLKYLYWDGNWHDCILLYFCN